MSTLWSRLRFTLRRLLHREAAERQLHDELESYLSHEIDARVGSGELPEDARRHALLAVGGVGQVEERIREARTGAVLDSVYQDVRYAFRTLTASRGFTVAVVGSLSIGIASTVVALGFVNGWMFRPYPGVVNQEQLFEVRIDRGCATGIRDKDCWYPVYTEDYTAMRDGLTGLDGFASFSSINAAMTSPSVRAISASFVSSNFFDVLGAKAFLGRMFTAEEEKEENSRVAVISHKFWLREFNGDPSVLGQTVRIANGTVSIIGVAPYLFSGLELTMRRPGPDIWMPAGLADLVSSPGQSWEFLGKDPRNTRYFGRRKSGVENTQIKQSVEALIANIAASKSLSTLPGRVDVRELSMFDTQKRPFASALLMIIPILVLALACVNAANVLLARGTRRGQEMAVRLAIGASRQRVIRQLLIESLLLAGSATVMAFLLAWAGLRLATQYLSIPMPLDASVIVLSLLIAAASAVGCGIVPALRVSAQHPASVLAASYSSSASRDQTRGRRILVIAQVALSLGLLMTGTQLVSVVRSLGGSVGTAADQLLLASFDLAQLKYSPDETRLFYQRLLQGVEKLPDAEAAGLGPDLWSWGRGKEVRNSIIGWPDGNSPYGDIYVGGATQGRLLEALGLHILQGRGFTPEDGLSIRPQVALVNSSFADQVFHGSAIGRTLKVGAPNQELASASEVRIIGIVESINDPQYRTRAGIPTAALFVPSTLGDDPARILYVRSRGTLDTLAPAVRELVRQIDPRVPILEFGSLEQVNERALQLQFWLARAAAILGCIALLLATGGLYGVVSYIVGLRHREIAVRLALGALRQQVVTMVLRQAMTMAVIGAAIGGSAGFAFCWWIQVTNRVQHPLDGVALGGAALLLLVAMLLASGIPARRAARLDPITYLRQG